MPTAARPARRAILLAALFAPLAIPLAIPLAAGGAMAQNAAPSFTLTLKDGAWAPQELEVPANQKFELRVVNAGTRSAEFESKDMRREKVIPAGQTAVISAGPLKPGSYEFFDDFNPKARGRIVAR
jgi:hypothetical protein